MNLEKLKAYEMEFFMRYPEGFNTPELQDISKKHKIEKMVALAQTAFEREAFENPERITEQMIKLVSHSSMVSLFEKPKFRDGVHAMSFEQRETFAKALEMMLYEDEEQGFNAFLECLHEMRLAKWPLMTACLAYYRPTYHVFIKPTTVKGIIQNLELEGLVYRPAPSYEFYRAYRDALNEMKTHVDEGLSVSNAHFSGFLMMCMGL